MPGWHNWLARETFKNNSSRSQGCGFEPHLGRPLWFWFAFGHYEIFSVEYVQSACKGRVRIGL